MFSYAILDLDESTAHIATRDEGDLAKETIGQLNRQHDTCSKAGGKGDEFWRKIPLFSAG